jgi:hypothetical protein
MGILDFILKKGSTKAKGVGPELYSIARRTFVGNCQADLKKFFSQEKLSDEQIFSILFEQFLVRLSICYHWLDKAFELGKITREERDKINVDLTLEIQDLACRMASEFQIDRYDFFFFTTDRIRAYRASYQDDTVEGKEEKENNIQFMKTASHILKVSLQTGIDNEAKNKSRGKKTSRTAKKAKAKTKESRAKKKINELTRKISEYISTDILDITDEVRKILKGQTTR